MEPRSRRTLFFVSLFCFATLGLAIGPPIAGSTAPSAQIRPQTTAPRDVTYCELAANPMAFDRARIRITAFAGFGSEHFVLSDPTCTPRKDSYFEIWVTFGGGVKSGSTYCCPGEGYRGAPPEPAKDAEFPLVADRTYRRFSNLLRTTSDCTVRVTVVGTLLVNPPERASEPFSGYGHFGCCSLFIIEKVENLDNSRRSDLDYSARGGSNAAPGCLMGSGRVVQGWKPTDAVQQQREADAGSRRWAFDDPERVALEAMRAAYGHDVPRVVRTKSETGLQVYEWRSGRSINEVVVIRPSILAHVARTQKVVWVASWVGSSDCEIEIRATDDVRPQVIAALDRVFTGPLARPELAPDLLARGKGGSGPKNAIYFSYLENAVAVELDERGWPSWIDVRPKTEYPVPKEGWGRSVTGAAGYLPLHHTTFESAVMFFDVIRPLGAKAGAIRRSGAIRTQQYQHGTVVWEVDPNGIGGYPAVRAFSVRWKSVAHIKK